MAPIGIHKKLKAVGNALGKGLSWVNTNVLKPLAPIAKFGMEALGAPSWAGNIYDGVTNIIDKGSKWLGYEPDDTVKNGIETVTDVVLDTQRTKDERKYFKKNDPPLQRPLGIAPKHVRDDLKHAEEIRHLNNVKTADWDNSEDEDSSEAEPVSYDDTESYSEE